MTLAVVALYICGALLMLCFLGERKRATTHPATFSGPETLLAMALWPLMILGFVVLVVSVMVRELCR